MSVTSEGELMALLSKCPFPSTPLGVLDWSCWFLVFFFHSWTPLTWTQWTPTLSLTPLFLGNSNKIGSEKGVFRLVTGVGRKKIEFPKNWVPLRKRTPRPSDSVLRCSTTEPQGIYGERGLLRSSCDTRPAYCHDQQCLLWIWKRLLQ